ncbi:hypothetical protein GE21DRAFT_1212465 [Neurospora crassa]|nr:hypothetical protein NEUTE2DRAFT_69413 [Neurospora tetrasperma FGSC 2509]KHE82896.1 hypothetical protein GE21DRAFT_1212465 [Neurospora crassa]
MVPETAWFSSVRASKLNGGTLRHAMLTSQSASRYDGRITRGAPCRYSDRSARKRRDLESIRSCEETGNTDTQALVRICGSPTS